MNRMHKSFTLGVNHLTDLSDDELAVFSGTIYKKSHKREHRKLLQENIENVAEFYDSDDNLDDFIFAENKHKFDWRDYNAITPVKGKVVHVFSFIVNENEIEGNILNEGEKA